MSRTRGPDDRSVSLDVVAAGAWVALATAVAYWVRTTIPAYPKLSMLLLLGLGLITALFVVVHVGQASATLRHRRRRWWVRIAQQQSVVYEERHAAAVRSISFPCRPASLGAWRQKGWHVEWPTEVDWDSDLPEWVRGRRGEIMKNIVDAFGGGTLFEFQSAIDGRD